MISQICMFSAPFFFACSHPQEGGSVLEKMEMEVRRVVDQARPAVVRVSVKGDNRTSLNYTAPRAWYSGNDVGGFGAIAIPEPPELPDAPEAPEMDEEEETTPEPRVHQAIKENLTKHKELIETLQKSKEAVEKARSGVRELRLAYPELLRSQISAENRRIGSGVCLGDGYILTTHTVAGGGKEITITLNDGKELKGNLVGSDEGTDLALIKADRSDLPTLKLGDSSNARIGSIGIYLSRSYGEIDNINFGFVTGHDQGSQGDPMLRLNFPILPGESGSPLMNSRGEIVGIASANFRRNAFWSMTPQPGEHLNALGQGLYSLSFNGERAEEPAKGFSYFIPSERIKRVVEDLKEFGKVRRAQFGITGTDTTLRVSDTESVEGVLIESIQQGSAAEKAGLLVGDVLIRCQGKPVSDFGALRAIIQKMAIGKPAQLVIRRAGKELNVEIIPQAAQDRMERTPGGAKDLGLSLVPKSKELAEFLNLADSPEGKVVASITQDGLAARAGIRKGDLLLDEPRLGKKVRVWRDGKTLDILLSEK